jgi:outer membrane protein TolC
LGALENRAQGALRESESLSARGATAPLDALNYQRDLLLVLRSAQELRRDLSVAKSQLSALMNLPPATHYTVEIPRRTAMPPAIRGSLDQLLTSAYLNRPELREVSYRQRINSREDEIAVLGAFPGISALLGINTSNNDLLYNQDWVNIGARVTWDAMNVARLPNRLRNVEAGDDLLDARALALTRAVAVQVVVSVANYGALRRELVTSAKYQNVSARILNETRARAQSGELGEQAQIKEEFEAILAELRFDLTYAETQTAYANLYSSIGLNPYAPDVTGNESVADLSGSLRGLWARREDVSAVAQTN